MVGDFDGDGKADVVFWTQGHQTLFFTRIPKNPKELNVWKLIPVYKYFADSQMEQHPGNSFHGKDTNEHEGLAKIDIDGDGIQDIVGGGMWFKYLGDDKFSFNTINGAYMFSRSAAGQLVKGGRQEVIMVVGDGKGNFPREIIVSEGFDVHESEIADLDGDGDLDVLGKPYNGGVPRLDIWLKWLVHYIHNYPVKAKLVAKPEDYLYSSARDYAGGKGLVEIELY